MLHYSAVCLWHQLKTVPIRQLVRFCRSHGKSRFPWRQMSVYGALKWSAFGPRWTWSENPPSLCWAALTGERERICKVKEVNWDTSWSAGPPRWEGWTVLGCPEAKTGRSVPWSSPPVCWSGSWAGSRSVGGPTCGRWWRPKGPRWGWGRRSGRPSGSPCRRRRVGQSWWSQQSKKRSKSSIRLNKTSSTRLLKQH